MNAADRSDQFEIQVRPAEGGDGTFVWSIHRSGEETPLESSDRSYRTAEKAREIAELELTRLETEGD